MQKFILLMGACLALAACGSGENEATKRAQTETPAATATAATATPIAAIPAQALSGEAATDAMKHRHDWFEEMGDNFKILNRQSKASAPDMAAVQKATAVIAAKSAQLPGLFAPGTGPDAGKTDAKAGIWENTDDFTAKAANFHEAATRLNAIAMAGDAPGFKEAFGKTGAACKACHDTFREED